MPAAVALVKALWHRRLSPMLLPLAVWSHTSNVLLPTCTPPAHHRASPPVPSLSGSLASSSQLSVGVFPPKSVCPSSPLTRICHPVWERLLFLSVFNARLRGLMWQRCPLPFSVAFPLSEQGTARACTQCSSIASTLHL